MAIGRSPRSRSYGPKSRGRHWTISPRTLVDTECVAGARFRRDPARWIAPGMRSPRRRWTERTVRLQVGWTGQGHGGATFGERPAHFSGGGSALSPMSQRSGRRSVVTSRTSTATPHLIDAWPIGR